MRLNRKVLVRGPIVPAAVDASFLLIRGTGFSAGNAGVPLLSGPTGPAVSLGPPESGRTYNFILNYPVGRNAWVYRSLFQFSKEGHCPEEFQALPYCTAYPSCKIWIDGGDRESPGPTSGRPHCNRIKEQTVIEHIRARMEP